MGMKKAYYYFFYKVYRSIEYTSELSGGKFLTFFKAGLVMIALEGLLLMSIGAYYASFTKMAIELSLSMPVVYIPLLIIFGFNYFTLDYAGTWKEYNNKFDKLPPKRNKIGGWIVFGIIVLIIVNLIYSFYLMSQVHWSKYQ